MIIFHKGIESQKYSYRKDAYRVKRSMEKKPAKGKNKIGKRTQKK
jgi:hypothetical protein